MCVSFLCMGLCLCLSVVVLEAHLLSRSTQRAMTLTVRTEVVKQCSSASCVVTW